MDELKTTTEHYDYRYVATLDNNRTPQINTLLDHGWELYSVNQSGHYFRKQLGQKNGS